MFFNLSLAEKDLKIREIQRQNAQLQSKIKLLEEENESLNDKIESTIKERNKLRRELQNNLATPVNTLETSPNSFANLGSIRKQMSPRDNQINNLTRSISIDPLDKTLKANSLSMSYWNELNASSCWDINYNTGLLTNKQNAINKDSFSKGSRDAILANHKIFNNYGNKKELNGSLATDLNSMFSSSRSHR
jgi:hypothetical protein